MHLAVLQQEAGAIVELITETDRNDVLYKKDEQGNTALHLATWRKNSEAGDREIYEKLIEAGAQRGRDDGTTNVERTNSISTCQVGAMGSKILLSASLSKSIETHHQKHVALYWWLVH